MHDLTSSGSNSGWIGSDDPWPLHPRPEAQKALKRARSAGWLLKPSKNGHSFGWLGCGHIGESISECRKSISCTSGAADGSTTARVIDDVMRKCPHVSDTSDAERKAEKTPSADVLLGRIAGLLRAAELLIERDAAQQRALDLIDDDHLDEDVAMDAAIDAERAATDCEQSALMATYGEGWATWPPQDGARHLVDLALALAAEFSVALADAEADEVGDLRERHKQLTTSLDNCLARLAG